MSIRDLFLVFPAVLSAGATDETPGPAPGGGREAQQVTHFLLKKVP